MVSLPIRPATEAEYLRARSELCKARLRANAAGVRHDVRSLLDVPGAIQQHPRSALAIGGALGFLTGRGLRSGSERAAETRRALAHSAVNLGRVLVLRALLA
jgi:hypothetical protein